jgi:Flp pilus assembly protein TadD
VQAADVLSWALYREGELEEAWQYPMEALRLGTRDPLFSYHGGMIALACGDKATARARLAEALSIHPQLSIVYAPHARTQLDELGGAAGGDPISHRP